MLNKLKAIPQTTILVILISLVFVAIIVTVNNNNQANPTQPQITTPTPTTATKTPTPQPEPTPEPQPGPTPTPTASPTPEPLTGEEHVRAITSLFDNNGECWGVGGASLICSNWDWVDLGDPEDATNPQGRHLSEQPGRRIMLPGPEGPGHRPCRNDNSYQGYMLVDRRHVSEPGQRRWCALAYRVGPPDLLPAEQLWLLRWLVERLTADYPRANVQVISIPEGYLVPIPN